LHDAEVPRDPPQDTRTTRGRSNSAFAIGSEPVLPDLTSPFLDGLMQAKDKT
jgi:hypothetical protein